MNREISFINKRAAELQQRMEPLWHAMRDSLVERQPDVEIECPEFDADEDADPLFDSTRDYVEQIDSYKCSRGDRPTASRAPPARGPRLRAHRWCGGIKGW